VCCFICKKTKILYLAVHEVMGTLVLTLPSMLMGFMPILKKKLRRKRRKKRTYVKERSADFVLSYE
jgi:hypothetical protein